MNNQNWSKYGITKPYYADDAVCIIHSNCKDILLSIPNEAIDLLVTDPPYGIGFMGKDWDKFNDIVNPQGAYEHKKGFKKLPRQSSQYMTEFFTPIWRECLRILKPGAFVFVMCIPRADCLSRMIISLEDAGFMVNFTPIFWAYASGFPKAQNISKMADKRGAHSPDDLRKFKRWFREQIDKSPKTQEQINNECGFTATSYYKTDSKDYWTSAFPIPTKWLVIKRVMDLSDDWDWLIKRYDEERGWLENPTGGLAQNRLTPFSGRQLQSEPYTPQAKALDGSYGGFQPKPAVEVIIVAMKPLSEKTYVDQALKNQKGITWLDDGRIPIQKGDKENWGASKFNHGVSFSLATPDKRGTATPPNPLGRFPANLLVSDDVLNDGRMQKSGVAIRHISGGKTFGGNNTKPPLDDIGYGDSGSFSRYFDLDRWFEKKLEELPASVQKTFPFLIVPKASKSEKNKGCEGLLAQNNMRINAPRENEEAKYKTKLQNNHPTVKPLKLMSYLITLGSHEGDIVLDLFLGSGTTALACKMLNRKCIGFEIEEKYCEIAAKRCYQSIQSVMGLDI